MKKKSFLKMASLERECNPCESLENQHTTHQLSYKKAILSILSLLLFIGVGCTHQMSVKNLSDYRVAPASTGNSFDVALAPYKSSEELRGFYRETVDALNRHPDVKMVRGEWTFHGISDEFNPDYIVNLDISAKYKGSGWNYPITFPGCYFFVGAASGYVYKADVTTDISVSTLSIDNAPSSSTDVEPALATDNASPSSAGKAPAWAIDNDSSSSTDTEPALATDDASSSSTDKAPAWAIDNDSSAVPTCSTTLLCRDTEHMHFNCRHCSHSRGFWSGSAWWMPGYGLHNIFTGFVYVNYDPAATEPFVEKSDETYGEYIAEKIVSMIANKQQGKEESTRLYLE